MISYDELVGIVKSKISKERFEHSLRVVDRAIEYAKIYKEDIEKVKLCAVAHDIAKEISEKEAKKYYRYLDEFEIKCKSLQHAKIGAIICEKFGFDEDMLNAIRYHTTGRENMSNLEKIICLADATEKGREGAEKCVEIIKKDIDKGMFEVSAWGIKYLLEKKSLIHLDTIKCYNYYFNINH